MYKIKCEWYRQFHQSDTVRIMLGQIKEAKIWKAILNETIDDLIVILPEDSYQKRKLEWFIIKFWERINLKCEEIKMEGKNLKSLNFPN